MPRGVRQALEDAEAAYASLQHDHEWMHVSLAARAMASVASDGVAAAEKLWAEAQWRGEPVDARPLEAVARGMQAAAAIRRAHWDEAEDRLAGILTTIEETGADIYTTSCLAYVEAARIATHRGDLVMGQRHMARAALVTPKLTAAFPVYSVFTLHEMARSYIEQGDVAGARQVIRTASDILALRPRLGVLVDEHEALRKKLADQPAGLVGPSSLTAAELRLLPYLTTHLTYPEIGERLYVSKHTVKTQAMSIYRKLIVSSRGEAVDKARDIGLINS